MKFQCGKCGKLFKIDNPEEAGGDLTFYCDNCDNKFLLIKNSVFSSASKNSKIVCANCGKFLPENYRVCDSCNLRINRNLSELKIDNNYYESLEVSGDGLVCDMSGKNLGNRRKIIPAIIVVTLSSLVLSYLFLSHNQENMNDTSQSYNPITDPRNHKQKETKVVIMKSGKTYYANQLEFTGDYVNITSENGANNRLLGKDILQITTATVER